MIYAIGDVHGKAALLRGLLSAIRTDYFQPDDQLVFLGDYLDRGEDSCGVIEMLLTLRDELPETVFLRGNHEQLMLDARSCQEEPSNPVHGFRDCVEVTINWLQNGGLTTLRSYTAREDWDWWKDIPRAHWEFLDATRLEYVTARYHFVHAGLLPPGVPSWEGSESELDPRLWIRDPFLESDAAFDGRVVVFGHTPQMNGRPLVMSNKIGLDTGAVFGGPLTAGLFDLTSETAQHAAPRFLQIVESAPDDPIERS